MNIPHGRKESLVWLRLMWVLVFFWLFYRLIQRSSSQSLQTTPENWKLFWSTWQRCRLTLHRVSMTLYWNFDYRTGHMNKMNRFELLQNCVVLRERFGVCESYLHSCNGLSSWALTTWGSTYAVLHKQHRNGKAAYYLGEYYLQDSWAWFVCISFKDRFQTICLLWACALPTKVSLLACRDLWGCWLFRQRESCHVCLKGLKNKYQNWPLWNSSELSALSAKYCVRGCACSSSWPLPHLCRSRRSCTMKLSPSWRVEGSKQSLIRPWSYVRCTISRMVFSTSMSKANCECYSGL